LRTLRSLREAAVQSNRPFKERRTTTNSLSCPSWMTAVRRMKRPGLRRAFDLPTTNHQPQTELELLRKLDQRPYRRAGCALLGPEPPAVGVVHGGPRDVE